MAPRSDGFEDRCSRPSDLPGPARDNPPPSGEAHGPDRSKVTVLATSDEKISKESEQTRPEPMFYAYKYRKGRAFTCVLGHYNWTFDDPYVRILLLRGMAWAAGESPYRFDPLVLRGVPLSE